MATSSGSRNEPGPMAASLWRSRRRLNSGTPLRNIGVCQCTHSSTPTGSTMATFVSPRKRFGKMSAWGGPSMRRCRARAGPSRRSAEPLEGLLEAGRPVDLDVTLTPVAHHGLDAALLADHPLVLGAYRLPQGEVDEAQVVPIEVVLGQHFPVGGAAMLDPARGQLDLALR